jgi:phosphopantothenoylcysteine decarboxylase/phosphopantothenate--cysteine ligase
VTLVAANVSLPPPPGVECRRVVTAGQLKDACEREFPSCDVLLMAAAVADFTPVAREAGKIAKAGRTGLELQLEPTADVLGALAARRRDGQILVGFAAEYGERAIDAAREKLTAKRLDAIVVNDISRVDIGFDSEHNEVTILTANDPADAGAPGAGAASVLVTRSSKAAVAEEILDAVERLRARN